MWFFQAVPHQAFVTWLAFHDRLVTGARCRAWGINQPCTLCGKPNETREHLFFACPYSFTVWSMLSANILHSRINPDCHITVHSLLRNRLTKNDALLVRMAFQASIYGLWREKNGGRHQRQHTSPSHLARMLHKGITNLLLSLRQDQEVSNVDDILAS